MAQNVSRVLVELGLFVGEVVYPIAQELKILFEVRVCRQVQPVEVAVHAVAFL